MMLQSPSLSLVFHSSSSPPLKTPLHLFTAKFYKRGKRSPTSMIKAKRPMTTTVTSKFELNPPPYPMNGLEPHMSRETLDYHWGKHQRAHLDSLNEQIEGTHLVHMSLEDIITSTYNKGDPLPSFNHAAQIWNHDFFWNSMKPAGAGGLPSAALLKLIQRDFGSLDRLLKEFKTLALSQFGSGWAWLVYKANNNLDVGNAKNPTPTEEDNKLMLLKTPNALNPLIWDYSPLLCVDVWEHAYYLDYENRCADYVSVFIENLVSWEVVSSRLEKSMAQAAEKARQAERRSEEEEMGDGGAVEMYLDSESDESEAEAEAE